jgi:hypothetical protein
LSSPPNAFGADRLAIVNSNIPRLKYRQWPRKPSNRASNLLLFSFPRQLKNA